MPNPTFQGTRRKRRAPELYVGLHKALAAISMSFDLYADEINNRIASLKGVSVIKVGFFESFFSMDTLTFIVGSGFASTLIFFPIAYLALAGQFRFKLSHRNIFGLFCLSVPLVGVAQALLGRGDSDTFAGWFVLFCVPLIICLVSIFTAYQLSSKRNESLEKTISVEGRIARYLRRFSRPAERAAFIVLIVGLCLLLIGLVGFWLNRGFYWSELKYDLSEIFIEETSYTHRWAPLCARIGLTLTAFGYAVAYHHERIVVPFHSYVNKFVRWLRTGK
jgi:hypothetical protein